MADIGLAFLAGVLSLLAPCVLPLAPIVLASALQSHRLGPLALACGLALAYAGLGVTAASAGHIAGLSQGALRAVAAWTMVVFGVVLLSAPLQRKLAVAGGPLMNSANTVMDRFGSGGLGGQFAIGVLLGVVWVPCVGPTLGAAIGLAVQGESLGWAGSVMAAFSLGAAGPLVLIAYGSRRLFLEKRDRLLAIGRWGKPVMGGLLLALGLAALSGLDKVIERALVQASPTWLLQLTTSF